MSDGCYRSDRETEPRKSQAEIISGLRAEVEELNKRLNDELAAARNELARLNGQTRWLCQCGGTPERTAELLAEVERLRRFNGQLYRITDKQQTEMRLGGMKRAADALVDELNDAILKEGK